jgi:hypothetical protein
MEGFLSIWKVHLTLSSLFYIMGPTKERFMSGKLVRRLLFGLALAICLGCWAWTFGTLLLFGRPGIARWTAMVTAAAFATEATVWAGAFTLGWSAFESRRRLWTRITGQGSAS